MTTTRALLLGHPRSGTTLLRRLLGAHPDLAAPPETHLFGAAARFLEAEETADGVDMGVLAGLHFAGIPDDEVLTRLRGLVFGLMDDVAAAQGKAGWLEKTAFDVFHLDGIERLCGDEVAYVAIVRHPLDVAVSTVEFCDAAGTYPRTLHRYVREHPQPIEAFAHSWLDSTSAMVALGQRRPDRLIMCRYEDLVDDPADTVAQIVDFLGLPGGDELAAAVADDEAPGSSVLGGLDQLGFSDHKSYQVTAIHEASVERWAALPTPQVERLAPLLNPMLDLLGYDLLDEGAPADEGDGRRRYLRSLAVHAQARAS